MNAKEAIKTALTSTKDMIGWYLGDLSDADLLVRPVPAANHIAWQMGHLIDSESHLLGQLPGALYPKLPEHNQTGVDFDDRRHFRYTGPSTIDVHAHVLQTRPADPANGPRSGSGPGASLEQAEIMLDVAREFGVSRVYSMCFPDDIPPL